MFSLSALEYIFKSKSENNDTVPVEKFVEVLKVMYHGITYENVIEEALPFATSKGTENKMRVTKFVALIEMVYMKEKCPPYPIAIALVYILEQIRHGHLNNGNGGNYVEAGKAQEAIDSVISSEISRRKEVLLSKHKRSFASLQKAHTDQYLNYKDGSCLVMHLPLFCHLSIC